MIAVRWTFPSWHTHLDRSSDCQPWYKWMVGTATGPGWCTGLKCHWIMCVGLLIEACVGAMMGGSCPTAGMRAQRSSWVRCAPYAGSLSHLKPLTLASWATPFFSFTADAASHTQLTVNSHKKEIIYIYYHFFLLTQKLQIVISSALQLNIYIFVSPTIWTFANIRHTKHYFQKHILNLRLSPADMRIFLW